jgi:uroporphyrinogen decarboxylase
LFVDQNEIQYFRGMNLKNDLLLRAARGEKVERTPVWLMRQAGRILPEYRKVREQAKGFKVMVKTPALASEVTVQPVDILGVDAAIIFSDILVIPEAMGLNYEVIESKGPWFEKTIQSAADIKSMKVADGNDLQYVLDAIALTKKTLKGRVPLIGFAGAPWTIFSYMIEGRGSKTFSNAKKFLYAQPALAHQLLEKITLSTINYLKAQIDAGADIIQLFDSWAGVLSPVQYKEFSLKYISMICDAINNFEIRSSIPIATNQEIKNIEKKHAGNCFRKRCILRP